MKRITFLKSLFLLFALIVGSTSVWAEESETITFSDIYGSPSSHINVNNVVFDNENGGLDYSTIVFKTASGSNSPQYNKSDKVIQFYKSNTMTITSTKYIKSVSCVISSSSYSGSNITVSETAYTCAIDDKTSLHITNSTTNYANSFVVTNGEAGQVKIKSITITYATPVISAEDVNIAADVLAGNITYSITNPDGSTLTAAKKTGDWLTVGAVDSENKKVAFTATENTGVSRDAVVTLTYGGVTKDVTVTQAAAATKYAVTFSTPSNGSLVVKRGDYAISSGTEVSEGSTLTIIATPNEGYNFDKWEYNAAGAGWNDGVGTTYEVTSAVEFRASFVAKEYKNIIWSADGVETIQSVEVGTAIDFSGTVTAPNGYEFKGWTASGIVGTQAAEPTYVTEATCTEDATYYAVFAKINVNEEEVTKSYGFETASDEDWTISGPVRSTAHPNTGTYSGRIGTNNTYVTFNSKVNVTNFSFAFARTSNNSNYYVYIETSANNQDWTAAATYNISGFSTDGTFSTKSKSFDGNTALYVRFHCYNTTAERFVDDVTIKYNSEVISFSNYCTTIPPVNVNITDLSSVSGSTYTGKNYATVYYSDLALAVPTGVVAKTYKMVNGVLTESRTYENGGTYPVIPAGEAVVLESEAGANYSFAASSTETTPDEDNALRGTDVATTVDADGFKYYKLAMNDGLDKVGFFFDNADGSAINNGAHKAYLCVATGAGAKSFYLLGEDTTTGIANLNVDDNISFDSDAPMYNLAGQRVTKAYQGVVIVNGKKMLNK